jgi:hypothetical protein
MSSIGASGKAQAQRPSVAPGESAGGADGVLTLRKEIGTLQDTVRQVADQLATAGVRARVGQADRADAGQTSWGAVDGEGHARGA